MVIVVIAVVAGSVGGYYYLHRSSGGGSQVVDDGPTFYQALGQLNASVQSTPGGPWTLYTVYGIATSVPFAPSALGWQRNNETVNSCGHLLDGLTLWNGSIPLFNGTFNSGTAPFWQLLYFSNSSRSILVATDVLGVPRVFPAIPMSSPCIVGSVLGLDPWSYADAYFTHLPSDSPALAASASAVVGPQWFSENPRTFEAYRYGNNYWGSGNPSGYLINFERCGEVGFAGDQPFASISLTRDGAFWGAFIGTEGCGNDNVSGGLSPYRLGFSSAALVSGGNATLATASFQAISVGPPPFSDAAGIVSWMIHLNLTSPAGSVLPPAESTCRGWVLAIDDCIAGSSGWFAVLQSPYGEWLDSYGASVSGSNWSIPNVSIVSNQQIVIICPASWNVTGDVLAASSTTADAPLSGSVTL